MDSPLRACLGGPNATPSKHRILFYLDGEENHPVNTIGESRRSSVKRAKPDPPESPAMKPDMTHMAARPDKRIRQMNPADDDDTSSTVSARREWLKNFGDKQKSTLPKQSSVSKSQLPRSAFKPKPAVNSPTRRTRQSISSVDMTPSTASALVSKMMSSGSTHKRNFNIPSKFRNRKEPVAATNDGHASVAELSQWLANDPTATKKKRHVRRGRNVITKSRKFEKDLEDVIVIENKIPRGNVKDRKKWLQDAFHEEDDDSDIGMLNNSSLVTRYAKSEAGVGDLASHASVSDKKDWLKNAFRTATSDESRNELEDCSRSEIVTNDAASSLSVSDKKDWLKNAFSKGAEGTPSKKPAYTKAMTDVMHSRRGGDDAAAKAKRRFLERSRRTPTKGTPTRGTPGSKSRHLMSGAGRGLMSPSVLPTTTKLDYGSIRKDRTIPSKTEEARTGPPSANSTAVLETTENREEQMVAAPTPVEEDATPVDFRAARQALIQRGKQNGHKMQVANKVFLKKSKFEKLEKEQRRRSQPFGLLKPSWDEADSESGLPSGAYERKFVEDIAPKKSFEELP